MNDWNLTQQLSQAAETVTVLLAGPQPRTEMWTEVISADSRFRITTIAYTPEDLRVKLGTRPEAILVDAEIFPSPEALFDTLTRISQGAVYVVLPAGIPADVLQNVQNTLQSMPVVHGVYHVDLHLAGMLEKMYGDARALRGTADASADAHWGGNGHGSNGNGNGQHGRPVATRIISVWNQMGGVGKTTVSSNLAVTAAQRGYPTLLIGLGAPDDLPLIMGLKKRPNITNWQANPTVEGLKLAVQKVSSLDVLGGFPDVLSEASAINLPSDHPGSIKSLVDVAIRAGYAVIVIDAPPTSLAAASMMVSNTLVIVGRADLGGTYRTVEAYRTVAERMEGMHNIPSNRIYAVLNRAEEAQFDANTWHKMASEQLGRPFIPILTTIPYIQQVNVAQNERALPIHQSTQFATALQPLADALFASNGHAGPAQVKTQAGKVLKLGPLKVRV